MSNIFQISQVRYKTPRMSHRFSLKFTGMDKIITLAQARIDKYTVSGSGSTSAKNRYEWLQPALGGSSVTDIQGALELALLSCNLPATEMEVVEASRFHDTARHISKFQTQGDMECTFYDYIQGSASAIMFVWQGLVGDRRTGAISYKSEYALPLAKLIEYGPTAPAEGASPRPLAEHAVINLYPKTVNLGEHSYESAQIRKVTVTFACDNIFPLYYANGDPGQLTAEEIKSSGINPLYNAATALTPDNY
jgi:hypothetical protein